LPLAFAWLWLGASTSVGGCRSPPSRSFAVVAFMTVLGLAFAMLALVLSRALGAGRVTAAVDLCRLPLGAGGHFVRFNGRVFEGIAARLAHRSACDL
jgi:hypothetical protein